MWRLIMRISDDYELSDYAYASLSYNIELIPSADYLIAKVKSKGVVFLYVLPVVGESTDWYRFKWLRD